MGLVQRQFNICKLRAFGWRLVERKGKIRLVNGETVKKTT